MMHAHVSSGAGVKDGRALPREGGQRPSQGPILALPCLQPGASPCPAPPTWRQRGTHERGRAPPVRTLCARRTHRMTSRDAA